MPVSFNTISGNIRSPLFYVETNAGYNGAQFPSRHLLIGTMLAVGTGVPGQPVLMNNNAEVLFGKGSELADMYAVTLLNAAVQEVWCLPLEEAAAGVAATGKITVAVPARSGTLVWYIGGVRYRTAVSSTHTATAIRDAMIAVVQADTSAFVTVAAGVEDDEIVITARHKGENGNTIGIDVGLRSDDGPLGGEMLTIERMANGAGNPDITAALANLGDEEFDFIGLAYSDTANLDAMEAFLDNETGRWAYTRQLYGLCITARNGTLGELDAFGSDRNDPHVSIMGVNKSPSPIWRWVAAASTRAAAHLQDPGTTAEISRPLQTLDLIGVLPPKDAADRWSLNARNTLYYSGIAAYHVERDGTVSIDRMVTTYQLNEWGSPDVTWLDLNTPAQIMFFNRFMKQAVTQKHGRQALADQNPSGNPGITTAADVKETIQFAYEDLVLRGVCENPDIFYSNLVVERDASDATRLNCYCPPDVVNQLRIFAMNVTTFLQYPASMRN
jgi:phage tail sheath gpL-like